MPDAETLAFWLAAVLPYLLLGGAEFAKAAAGELGKRLSAAMWEGLTSLAERIRQKAQDRPALAEALADAQAAPQNSDALVALRLQLRKLLQDDPDLRTEAERLLADVVTRGNIPIANGNRSIAIGGDAHGNILITGDNNWVEKG